MRNEIVVEKLGRPLNNLVLVEVIDTFDSFVSKGGIRVVNATADEAWADSNVASITEFIPRHGTVVALPRKLTSASFDYETEMEIKVGDVVYWNSISFKESIPLVYEDKKYLLVDYHELHLRIRRNRVTPINGFVILRPVPETATALEYKVVTKVTLRWEIFIKPQKQNRELNPANEFEDIWEVGDIVYLLVRDMPFRIEGYMNKLFNEQLYAVPLRMILYSQENVDNVKATSWLPSTEHGL